MNHLQHTAAVAAVLATTLISSAAQAMPASPPAVPVPPEVVAGIIVANELAKPKPFCRVIKIFKKKKRC